MAKRWREDLGFATSVATRPVILSKLHQFVSEGTLVINDDRMKAEVNTFIYNKKGKPEAEGGKHDDMVFAWALALAGINQIDALKEEKLSKKPSSLREILAYERATGRIFRDEWEAGDEESLDVLSQPHFARKGSIPAKIPRR
jgi:hypothetical protein